MRQVSPLRFRLTLLSRIAVFTGAPSLALAQASPFLTGATSLQTNILAWLTPVAIILVMALGAMAMTNRLAWGWCIGAILDWTDAVTFHYARIRAALERAGQPIGNLELMIASHAVAEEATVVTNNVRHFASVPGLKVEEWK